MWAATSATDMVGLRRSNEEMHVVRHQAEREHAPLAVANLTRDKL
jgi:hypothetical protein